MRKTFVVARREYISTVRRKGFIIATFGLPLFIALMYVVYGGVIFISARQAREKVDVVGLVDESGLFQMRLIERIDRANRLATVDDDSLPPMFRERARAAAKKMADVSRIVVFKNREDAQEAFVQKEIRGYYVVPADFLQSGVIRLEVKKGTFMANNSPGWSTVQKLAAASLVEGKLDAATAERVWNSARLRTEALGERGEKDSKGQFAELTGFVVPYVFALFFMMALMTSAGYLMQTVSEEKENRVIEVLISSITPDELLSGKIIGLCGAGLTQVLVWIVIGIVPGIFLLPFLELRWDQLVAALVFFPLGFFVYGSLIGSAASLGNNQRESQQMSMIWSISAVIPMFAMTAILSQPNGTIARVLSCIPLTAPMTMMMRVGAARVAWWEIASSALIMIASLYFILKLAAKLFRIGTLMYGKRPSLVEIVRWMKAA